MKKKSAVCSLLATSLLFSSVDTYGAVVKDATDQEVQELSNETLSSDEILFNDDAVEEQFQKYGITEENYEEYLKKINSNSNSAEKSFRTINSSDPGVQTCVLGMTSGAALVKYRYGHNYTAALMLRSLNPTSKTHVSYASSRIGKMLAGKSSFKNAIKNHSLSKTTSRRIEDDHYFVSKEGEPFTSIGKYKYKVTVKYLGSSKYSFSGYIYDKYDFTYVHSRSEYSDPVIFGNNFAYKCQKAGVVTPFPVKVWVKGTFTK